MFLKLSIYPFILFLILLIIMLMFRVFMFYYFYNVCNLLLHVFSISFFGTFFALLEIVLRSLAPSLCLISSFWLPPTLIRTLLGFLASTMIFSSSRFRPSTVTGASREPNCGRQTAKEKEKRKGTENENMNETINQQHVF